MEKLSTDLKQCGSLADDVVVREIRGGPIVGWSPQQKKIGERADVVVGQGKRWRHGSSA